MQKVKEVDARLWYAHAAVEYGWSRAVLTHQIETQLHRREGKAITNFAAALPAPQSDLAHQTLKDPYIFDFLTMDAGARERDLELGLLNHVQKFLVELGVGFAFVGRQYPLEVSGEEFFLDLLFYHLRLRCFMVVDLKMEAFKPEFAGKIHPVRYEPYAQVVLRVRPPQFERWESLRRRDRGFAKTITPTSRRDRSVHA